MLRDLRIKVATSVNRLNAPDDLVWKRWLKPPSTSASEFGFEFPGLIQHEYFEQWLDPTLTEACEFYLKKVSVLQRKAFDKFLRIQPSKSMHFLIIQPKSHRLFFQHTSK